LEGRLDPGSAFRDEPGAGRVQGVALIDHTGMKIDYLSHRTGYAFSIPVASRIVSFTDKLPKHPTGSGR